MRRDGCDPPSPGGGGSAAEPPGRGEPSDRLARFRRARARVLRSQTTRVERLFWAALIRVPVQGTHYRRQVPIGPYVVDFACLASRLVVELDGPSHSYDGTAERDRVRQAWLEREGFRVLRFWNGELISNLDGVLDTIYAELHGSLAAEPARIVHKRRRSGIDAHPTPALRADPHPPGEGEGPGGILS